MDEEPQARHPALRAGPGPSPAWWPTCRRWPPARRRAVEDHYARRRLAGDERADRPDGGTGVLRRAARRPAGRRDRLRREHSLTLPAHRPPPAARARRRARAADGAGDALVGRDGSKLADLPAGAASAPARRAGPRSCDCCDPISKSSRIRGNVETPCGLCGNRPSRCCSSSRTRSFQARPDRRGHYWFSRRVPLARPARARSAVECREQDEELRGCLCTSSGRLVGAGRGALDQDLEGRHAPPVRR